MPTPRPSAPWGTTNRRSVPKPTTWSPRTTAAMPPALRHSAGVSARLMPAIGSPSGSSRQPIPVARRSQLAGQWADAPRAPIFCPGGVGPVTIGVMPNAHDILQEPAGGLVLLGELDESDWERLIALTEREVFTAGAVIGVAGEVDRSLLLVLSGTIDLRRADDAEP